MPPKQVKNKYNTISKWICEFTNNQELRKLARYAIFGELEDLPYSSRKHLTKEYTKENVIDIYNNIMLNR